MKSLEELILASEATWSLVQEWVSQSGNNVEVLTASKQDARAELHQLQVSTQSVLGTVAYYTGGILVDHGWLRFLGSGSEKLPRSLTGWNQLNSSGASTRLHSSMLIADDAVGGFFAMNGGAFEGRRGDVFYFAPDTLEWESLDMQYSDFLYWALLGDVQGFYESFRWASWLEEGAI